MFTDLARSNTALKQLLDEIMHEPDPAKYDLLGSEIWSVLAERERLDLVKTSLKIMESTLLGMKQLRPYLGDGSSREYARFPDSKRRSRRSVGSNSG